MRKYIYLFAATILFSGCFAIVDNSAEGRKVTSFMVTKDEAIDILDRVDESDPEQTHEIRWIRK